MINLLVNLMVPALLYFGVGWCSIVRTELNLNEVCCADREHPWYVLAVASILWPFFWWHVRRAWASYARNRQFAWERQARQFAVERDHELFHLAPDWALVVPREGLRTGMSPIMLLRSTGQPR